MRAIIIVSDKLEEGTNWRTKVKEKCCNCVKVSSAAQSEKLVKYLRKKTRLRKKNIILLHSSRYRGSQRILKELSFLFDLYKKEDILIFYSGHGGRDCWGFNNYPDDVLEYRDLENIFWKFQGRLVLINDCCYALAIQSCLRKCIRGRFLLFGSSRKDKIGDSFVSILNPILKAWLKKKKAFPEVIYTEGEGSGTMDICSRRERMPIGHCACSHDTWPDERRFLAKKPSLRRGSNLDFLFFPK